MFHCPGSVTSLKSPDHSPGSAMPRSAACPGPGLSTPSPGLSTPSPGLSTPSAGLSTPSAGLTLEQFTEIVLAQERLEEDRGDRGQQAVITHRQVSRAARYSVDIDIDIDIDRYV